MRSAKHFADNLRGSDAWAWWQRRRPHYNLVLGAAGLLAYFTAIAQSFAFGRPMWLSPLGALGMTLFLGSAYLILMGVANLCFGLGALIEVTSRPTNLPAYRRAAWRMGLWGSIAVPFIFPLTNLLLLAGRHGA